MEATLTRDRHAGTVDIPVPDGPVDLSPDDVLTVEEIPQGPGHFGTAFNRCG
jgi:hypothetical protein